MDDRFRWDAMPAVEQLLGTPIPPGTAPGLLGLVSEGRAWYEAGALFAHPVWRGRSVPDGNGLPVLLIPGFMAGDPSLATMRRWLRARGYWTCASQIRLNADCTVEAVDRLEQRLVALA